MLIALFIYLAEMASKLSKIFCILSFVSGLPLLVLIIYKFIKFFDSTAEGNTFKEVASEKSLFRYSLITFIVFSFITIITPQEKTMYMMAGAYLGTELITNKIVSDKLDKVNKIIDFKLNEIIKEYEKGNK